MHALEHALEHYSLSTLAHTVFMNGLQYLLVAIYWSSETLLGDLGRNECKPSMSTEQVVSEKVIYCCTSLTRTSTNVHDFEPIAMHAAINPSQLRHVISISLARSMHL